MRTFLRKRWFILSLVLLITVGLTMGANLSADGLEALRETFGEPWRRAIGYLPRAMTAIVLFLMAFTLDSRHLRAACRSPKPVLWGAAVNYGVIPLLIWPLMALQPLRDFSIGLAIAASAPCTMAAASVWTRRAHGNDAVSLMVTLTTNTFCFAIAPFWLEVLTGSTIDLGLGKMMVRLLVVVLIPTLLGQAARLLPKAAGIATRHKTPIGVLAQSLILVLVFYAAFNAGGRLRGTGPNPPAHAGPAGSSIALVWGCCIAVHLVAMALALGGAKLFGFTRPDRIAVAFAGSQKTLPIGVLLATDPRMFGDPDLLGPGIGVPFAVFPMLMYHASQLFLDTSIADRFALAATPDEGPEASLAMVPPGDGGAERNG